MIVKPEKKHWYLLSFSVQHPGAWIPMSFVHGFTDMRITIPELRTAKQLNQVGDNSVMLAVSYMGYGSEREINGMPEVDPPSHTSEYFRAGVAAAMVNPATNTFQPVNPYTSGAEGDLSDPHVQFAAAEWKAGFDLQRQVEAAIAPKTPVEPEKKETPKSPDTQKPQK